MKKFWWIVVGVVIVVTVLIAGGKSTKSGISTEEWRQSSPVRPMSTLPGVQMECVGGKLDPICIGHRFSMAQGKYGNWASHVSRETGKHGGSTSGIAGWYIGRKACRFYYVTEDSIQCLHGSPCPIIKEIACE